MPVTQLHISFDTKYLQHVGDVKLPQLEGFHHGFLANQPPHSPCLLLLQNIMKVKIDLDLQKSETEPPIVIDHQRHLMHCCCLHLYSSSSSSYIWMARQDLGANHHPDPKSLPLVQICHTQSPDRFHCPPIQMLMPYLDSQRTSWLMPQLDSQRPSCAECSYWNLGHQNWFFFIVL